MYRQLTPEEEAKRHEEYEQRQAEEQAAQKAQEERVKTKIYEVAGILGLQVEETEYRRHLLAPRGIKVEAGQVQGNTERLEFTVKNCDDKNGARETRYFTHYLSREVYDSGLPKCTVAIDRPSYDIAKTVLTKVIEPSILLITEARKKIKEADDLANREWEVVKRFENTLGNGCRRGWNSSDSRAYDVKLYYPDSFSRIEVLHFHDDAVEFHLNQIPVEVGIELVAWLKERLVMSARSEILTQ